MSIAVQNRNDIYKEILEKLPEKRLITYSQIKDHQPVTPQQLCDKYDLKFNEVAPRFTELAQAGYIKEVGTVENSRSKKPNTVYVCTTQKEYREIRWSIATKLRIEYKNLYDDLMFYGASLSEHSADAIQKRMKIVASKLNKYTGEGI